MKRTFAALILCLLSWTVYAADTATGATNSAAINFAADDGSLSNAQFADAQSASASLAAAQPRQAAPAQQPASTGLLPPAMGLDKLQDKVDLDKVTAQGKKTLIYLVSKTPDALQETHTYVISLPDKYRKYLFAPTQARRWFVAGAVVFGFGIIIGLYIGKLAWRSKKYMLR